MRFLVKVTGVIVLMLSTSCVKDVDFDQANALELNPIYSASLVRSSIPQTAFFDPTGGTEVLQITDQATFTALDNSTTQDYLTQVDLTIEISNPFNRDFTLDFEFLDALGNPTYILTTLNIGANDVNFSHIESIIIANNPTFLQTEQIRTTFRLLPGTIIDQTIPRTLTFKSAGTFYFQIN